MPHRNLVSSIPPRLACFVLFTAALFAQEAPPDAKKKSEAKAPAAKVPKKDAGKDTAKKGNSSEKKDKKKKEKKKDQKKDEKKVPPKKSAQPRVVINEILYHPVPDDPAREFVELLNPNPTAVDMGGWSLSGEVRYSFPPGTLIEPGKFLVIGGDPKVVGSLHGLPGVLGPLKGKFSRKGGTLALLDSRGDLVEEVAYDEKPPFPPEAAGAGASLERIHPDFKAGWHWRGGQTRSEWIRVERRGLLSGDRLLFYLSGEGACRIDDVRVTDAGSPGANPAQNAVPNPGFESGLSGWQFTGNHAGSRVEGQVESEVKEGKAALLLTASGPGFGEIHSASVRLAGIPPTASITLSFWARREKGSPLLVARIEGEGLVTEEELPVSGGSPGAPNRFQAADLEPWVSRTWHEPERPLPGQPVVVFARVEDDQAVGGVTLEYAEGDGEVFRNVPMADHGFRTGSERAFSAMLPPLADGTVVRYRVAAVDAGGKPAPAEAQKAFYVGKPSPRGKAVPAFELLISPGAAEALERQKTSWVPGMLIFDGVVHDQVRVRHRGHSSLGFPKRHFKLHFDGEKFEGTRTVNLSASWADKSYLRDLLAHSVFAQAGVASCEVKRFARLFVNGKYWGLYYQMEQPGRDYLKRNNRDPDGDLYKCYTQGRPSPSGSYSPSDYQNKTQKDPHYDLLHQFLTSMDSLAGAELLAYQKKHLNADDFAGYLAATALVMNSDHVGKNYYLYRDPQSGKWSMFPWDLDLTFGRNFECRNSSALLNDQIRWDNHILFGTEAYPKCDIRGNRLIEKFLSLPENRILLYKKVQRMLKDFTVPQMNRLLRPHYLAIKSEVPLDRQRWGAYGAKNTWDFDRQVEEIQRFIQNRGKFLSQGLRAAAAQP